MIFVLPILPCKNLVGVLIRCPYNTGLLRINTVSIHTPKYKERVVTNKEKKARRCECMVTCDRCGQHVLSSVWKSSFVHLGSGNTGRTGAIGIRLHGKVTEMKSSVWIPANPFWFINSRIYASAFRLTR